MTTCQISPLLGIKTVFGDGKTETVSCSMVVWGELFLTVRVKRCNRFLESGYFGTLSFVGQLAMTIIVVNTVIVKTVNVKVKSEASSRRYTHRAIVSKVAWNHDSMRHLAAAASLSLAGEGIGSRNLAVFIITLNATCGRLAYRWLWPQLLQAQTG
jgi:hypothetical protein